MKEGRRPQKWVKWTVSTVIVLLVSVLPAGVNAGDWVIFDGFGDLSELNLNGIPSPPQQVWSSVDSCYILRLTPASATDHAGSVFSYIPVCATGFSTYFEFRISNPGGIIYDCNTESGADGIVFVIQANAAGVGSLGQGIGYSGLNDSVGIEFDTWCNDFNDDPSSNHIGIDLNGVVDHDPSQVYTIHIPAKFDNGDKWYVWIDYDGAILEVRANQTGMMPNDPLLTRELNIPAEIGSYQGFVGFTSATGDDWGDHDIIYWKYKNLAPGCPDLDGDGEVGLSDLSELLGAYNHCIGSPQYNPAADFDCNGCVDTADLSVLLSEYGSTCSD
jgi:hypothetical protein